ncbi:DUF3311 domain-containing protein [Pilimelia anulata]|nr:DUF3311 domain-containing protein [Pilimelia anulata]
MAGKRAPRPVGGGDGGTSGGTVDDGARGAARRTQGDRNPWYWLLAIPVVIPLITAVYNTAEPRLFGLPAFYWVQLAWIGLGVVATAAAYLLTRGRR